MILSILGMLLCSVAFILSACVLCACALRKRKISHLDPQDLADRWG